MPELPEVETVKRGLKPFILNKKIVQVEVKSDKGFQGAEADVNETRVIGLRRRGKALLIDLDNGFTLMIHLRMTGQQNIWRKEATGYWSATTETEPERSTLWPWTRGRWPSWR